MTIMLVTAIAEYNAATGSLNLDMKMLGPDTDNDSTFNNTSVAVMSVINRLASALSNVCRSRLFVNLCKSTRGSFNLALNSEGYTLVITVPAGTTPTDLKMLMRPVHEMLEASTRLRR